jgi:hypothetical protein
MNTFFDGDPVHTLILVALIAGFAANLIMVILGWLLLHWHYRNGLRLSALEAWRLDEMAQATEQREHAEDQADAVAATARRLGR